MEPSGLALLSDLYFRGAALYTLLGRELLPLIWHREKFTCVSRVLELNELTLYSCYNERTIEEVEGKVQQWVTVIECVQRKQHV